MGWQTSTLLISGSAELSHPRVGGGEEPGNRYESDLDLFTVSSG